MRRRSRIAPRLTAVLALVLLPLLAACGDDDDNKRRPTPTATQPAATATATATGGVPATATATESPTATATSGGPVATATNTQVPTATATAEPSATPTQQPSATPTVPPTATATALPTGTATATATAIPTGTATATATAIPTGTATATATAIPTGTGAATATPTPTMTAIPTGTTTATVVPTAGSDFRDLTDAAEAPFTTGGSVGQVYVTGATPGEVLELVNDEWRVIDSGTVDEQGALIFREVPVASGYRVVGGHPGPLSASEEVRSMAIDEHPDPEFYQSQELIIVQGNLETGNEAYGYLRMRDGTLLAAYIVLPGPGNNGPYPTVIEYSGYDPANPQDGIGGLQPSSLISSVLGYAVVGVNIRGTGCSGGAFQFFEPLQWTDGYDVVETIAAQPWVLNNKVGMVGLSYPGISQLFVAQLQPPSLASIAPLSVISDTGRGTLYPGGILNNGFATDWAEDRRHDAQPFGQPWSRQRRDLGDQICIDNQALRLQSPDILEMIEENRFYIPEVADPVTPALFVDNITVPVFLACSWQDEQVGGYCPTMLDRFLGAPNRHFTVVNGGHTEPLMPAIFHRWIEFLSFYVRREVPQTPSLASAIVDYLGSDIFRGGGLALPADRFTGMSYEDALAAFEAEQAVRVLFESGAGDPVNPGSPIPAFEQSFDEWPIPGTVATPWYFASDGRLVDEPVEGDTIDSFLYDTADAQKTNLASSNGDLVWRAAPPWNWQPLSDDRAVAYVTEPLETDTVLIGSASADLLIRASAPDVDLQVTISEVRPDGMESYIQTGWLRASRRKLNEELSTELRPLPTHLEVDAQPLPAGEFVPVRVEIFPFAHAFRAGSRIRVAISAPGRDRAIWKFRAVEVEGSATVEIAVEGSRIVLPVIPDVEIPTALPACEAIRNQPCREYVEIDNAVE